MGIYTAILAVICALVAARWATTPPADPDKSARRDVALLMVVVTCAQALATVRSHYLVWTRTWWLLTVALLPFLAAAVTLIVRLAGAWRRGRTA